MADLPLQQLGKALDFIEQHLEEPLSVEKIATVANYSPFHFQRLFKAYTGETLLEFYNRKRIEKIAALLIRDTKETIGTLAFQYGFSDNAALTKAFKKRYSVSPTAFRKQRSSRYDKIKNSRNGQIFQGFEAYIWRIENLKNWMEMNAVITVEEMVAFPMMYTNHIGIENLDTAFTKVIEFALENKLTNPEKLAAIRIYHDSFKITAPEKVRMEIGVVVDRETQTEPGIFFKNLSPGKCITANFEIDLADLEKAWSSLYIWMNENDYRPAEELPFEIIRNNYKEHPQQKCRLTLCIPVVPKTTL
ncbi:AraC family transcriptional regulator [Flavobacterium supellecticarium]|uniref:AraC family transcriptional regulator n=1 Tax=Flavobacterium supellecticarium TaxID=2565924 RepID=A0A4S4A4B6_9FLAO|nr:helix-turn-helix domain-containing protein [Flavobacterium supellecticarium]THF53324.1 AraC family transcriptional regulator [Flavobacterium supellecticarium]